jgi:hypothetical protein
MPYTETGKEKAKREAYMKANKERGIRQEQERDYKMFGTTEQNIPPVDTMGNVTGMKKGGKVMKKAKRYEEGGEIETKQGGNSRISDEIRERALKAVSEGGQKSETAPMPKAKRSAVRSQPESDREEYSPWMRDLRKQEATEEENKRESQALFNKKPVDTTSKEDPAKVAKAYQDAAKMQSSRNAEKRMSQVKESFGMKKGGSVKAKSASSRADGCCIRGKTRA